MDIYLRRLSGLVSRLGFAPAAETTEFALAPAALAGSASFRLEARPARGGGRSLLSEPYTIRPGEELLWSIPPQ